MRIRSLTIGAALPTDEAARASLIARLGEFARAGRAALEAAACVKALATGTPDGFGNLRFAAAANCPPHVPFFPASYYAEDERNGGGPEFGLALEEADLAVQAFEGARSHEEARENLLGLLVEQGERAGQVC